MFVRHGVVLGLARVLPCVPRSSTTYKNQVAEALLDSTDPNAEPALYSGTVVNSGLATFTLTDKTAPITVQERSQIESLQILHNSVTGTNLVAADVIDVKGNATRAGNGAADVSGSTTFVNLEIRGNSQSNEPAPNTEIALDALGSKVILNEQTLLSNTAGTKVIGIRSPGSTWS